MVALVEVLGVIIVLAGLILVVGWIATAATRRSELTKSEKQELEALRDMTDKLLDLSVSNMDVEPFARVVYDTIRDERRGKKKKELG